MSVCWMIFVVFWVVAAFSTKKTAYRQPVAERGISGALLIAGAATLLLAQRGYPLNPSIVPHTHFTAAVATLVTMSGLAFAPWARIVLGRNWSGRVTLKENHELILRGPYQFVRHPIYTGLLTMVLGSVLLVGRAGALLGWLVFVAGLWLKTAQEEKLLLTQFPAEYAAYRQHVRRIIPFVL
ncbi:MAG TPA: isoprenylcysteine carboxylmethyltransferase family protein [Thermoanaerobaculia bacterium]